MLVFLQQQKNATVVVYSLLEKSLKKFELAGCPSQYARITPFSAQKKVMAAGARLDLLSTFS
jgi:hypothetical protein